VTKRKMRTMSKGVEAVKEMQDFLNRKCPQCGRSKADLIITDVPVETRKWFRELGNSEEFRCGSNKVGHYGYLLKFLCDFYRGRIIDGSAIADAKAEEALAQIAELKNEPEEKVIRSVSGNIINAGGKK